MKILGMDIYRRKTDEELVEIVRNNLRRSKWFFLLSLLFLIFYLGCFCFLLWSTYDEKSVLVKAFNSDTSIGNGYKQGILIGFVSGLGLGIMGIFASGCLFWCILILTGAGNRKERLLLRYHDELQALGRIPQDDSRC